MKVLKFTSIILGLVSVLVAVQFGFFSKSEIVEGQATPVCYLGGQRATSSPVFMTTAGATTTLVCLTDGAKSIGLNVLPVASTTGTTKFLITAYTGDGREDNTGSCVVKENCNWFQEDYPSVSDGIITHQVAFREYTPTSKAPIGIIVDTKSARYMRFDFSVTGANGSLYVQGVADTNR